MLRQSAPGVPLAVLLQIQSQQLRPLPAVLKYKLLEAVLLLLLVVGVMRLLSALTAPAAAKQQVVTAAAAVVCR
jgi:hypothetical protein